MLIAITREVSPSLNACELTHLDRSPIDVARAQKQHAEYRDCLARLGAHVVALPALPDFPDSVFVEDPAIVLDEIAILTRSGAESRRGEGAALADTLARYRPLATIEAPGTLEGGDLVRLGRQLFVGKSSRSNADGARQLAQLTEPFGYSVVRVGLRDCLHLKSACCPLGDGRVLANRAWIDAGAFDGVEALDVPEEEPRGATVLRVRASIVVPAAHPRTADLLAEQGFDVVVVDNSELMKAESGLTCSSLVFES